MSKTPKSHWNYRVLRHAHVVGDETLYTFDIREVYYRDGVANGTTVDPMYGHGETLEELQADMKLMAFAFERPVIDGDNFPTEL